VIRGWVTPADPAPWKGDAAAHPVAVYADRSGSMAGFLDPAFPTRTDYRSVIDGLQARLSPQVVYGFGTTVRREPRPGLRVMGDRGWYGDRNTETEQALDSIAADSAHGWTHIVVTDGRRTDPRDGYGQFEQMRTLAESWIRAGGTFMVAVSLAPFTPVPNDPSGCHADARRSRESHDDDEREGDAAGSGQGLRCPLYAFVFAAPGDGMRVGATMAQLFDHVWMYPAPTAPNRMFALGADAGGAGSPGVQSSDRARIAIGSKDLDGGRVGAPLRVRLEQPDTTSSAGRLVAALLASGTRAELSARGVTADSAAADWRRQDGRTGAVRVDAGGRALDVFSPGGDDCQAAGENEPCGTLYRLELYPTGAPAWLEQLEARDAADVERTFGLGRLFESFRANVTSTPPLARAYLLVR